MLYVIFAGFLNVFLEQPLTLRCQVETSRAFYAQHARRFPPRFLSFHGFTRSFHLFSCFLIELAWTWALLKIYAAGCSRALIRQLIRSYIMSIYGGGVVGGRSMASNVCLFNPDQSTVDRRLTGGRRFLTHFRMYVHSLYITGGGQRHHRGP